MIAPIRELKPLVATLRELGFYWYLQSNSFDNLMLENDLDELWIASIREVNSEDTIYAGNTRIHEDSFNLCLNTFWADDREMFYEFVFISVVGFIKHTKSDKDISKIVQCMVKLNFDESQIMLITLEMENKTKTVASNSSDKLNKRKDLIFIGHGKGLLFREVEEYLRGENLPFESFETNNHTGNHIVDILKGFLERATFAIIIVTADDEIADGSIRARQNVIHEIGLFQGRLGFEKVAILKQEGAEPFSNNAGLQHISFQKEDIQSAFYRLGQALKREGLKK